METRAKYALVGSIVLGIVTIFALTLFWLSRQRDSADTRLYVVYFRKFSLSGLQVNGWVTMRGIKVGAIESVQISRKDIELVKVVLRLQKDTPVKEDSEAVIERNLLTGLASIDLVNSTQESPLLEQTPDEDYPVIPEGKTGMAALQDNLPQLFERVALLTNRVNSFLTPENEAAFSTTLANLRAISQALADKRTDLAQGISNLSAASSGAREFFDHLDTRSAAVTQSIAHAAEVAALEVSRAGQAVAAMADSVRTTLEGYEDPQALLRGRAPSSRGPGEEKRR